jgi:hypothetical protein
MPGGISFAPTNGVGYFFALAPSSAAPIATPTAIQTAMLSVAAPMATPIAIPAPIPEPLGNLLAAKGSEVQADDLWVVQQLSTGSYDRILALV